MANNDSQEAFVTGNGEELMLLSRAAKERGVSQNYLRFSIFNKKLQGVKIKGVWYTTRPWMDEYFRSIIPRKAKHTELHSEGEERQGLSSRGSETSRSTDEREFETRLTAMEKTLRRTEKRLFAVGLAAILITVVSVSAALEVFPMEAVKKMAQGLSSLGMPSTSSGSNDLFSTSSNNKLLVPDPAEGLHYAESLFAAAKSSFNSTRSQISISQNPSSPPFEKGRSGGISLAVIASPDFSRTKQSLFAFSSLRLPTLSLPSFFSELFKPSPPPPSEITIPKREDAQNTDIQSTNKTQNQKPQNQKPQTQTASTEIPYEVQPRKSQPVVIREFADSEGIRNSLMSELSSLNQSLKNEITQDLSSLRSLYSRLSESNQSQTRIITLSQKIDNLGDVTLNNVTFSGSSNSFNLKDSDIPDDISLTGSINPSSLSVSETITVSGTGTSTFSGGIQATLLNITSTTATSTFSNGIQLSGGCFKNSQGDCLTSTSPGGSDTQIQFNSNSAFGGDSNLIWDNTNKRLGLGTTTPASLLSVHGNALISGTSTVGSLIATSTLFVGTDGSLFNVLQSGRVGIGTTSPGSLLSIHGGNLQVTGTSTAHGLIATSTLFVGSNGNLFNVLSSGFTGIGTTSPGSLLSIHGGNAQITGTTTASALIATSTLYVGSQGQRLIINEQGNLGIGTTSPGSLLSIQGISNFVSNATSTLYTTLSLPNLYSTSTIATSSIAGSLYVASSTPTQNALFAVGTSSPLLWVDRNTGRIGVGTSSPGQFFSVAGNTLLGRQRGDRIEIVSDVLNFVNRATTTILSNAINAWSIATSTTALNPALSIDTSSTTMASPLVGIGTLSPDALFEVRGGGNDNLAIAKFGALGASGFGRNLLINNLSGGIGIEIENDTGAGDIDLILQADGGNVGIGTTSPGTYNGATGKVTIAMGGASQNLTPGLLISDTSANTDVALSLVNTASGGKHWQIISSGGGSGLGQGRLGFYDFTATRMVIDNSGNVGIGTTNPDSKTQITGGGLCVGSDANCNTDNNTEGTVYSGTTAMTVYDVAENYPTKDSTLSFAEIVALDKEYGVFVKRASSPQDILLGVISEKPAVHLGGFNGAQFKEEKQVAVGLSGRIPVKVNLEGGDISIGDHLTLSSTPGVAKKAASGEQSLGIALENWTSLREEGNLGTRTIQFFINLGYSKLDTEIAAAAQGSPSTSSGTNNFSSGTNYWNIDQQTGKVTAAFTAGIDLKGNSLENVSAILSANGRWSIDEQGKLVVQELEVKGKGITIYDRATNEPYCSFVENGVAYLEKGKCSDGR